MSPHVSNPPNLPRLRLWTLDLGRWTIVCVALWLAIGATRADTTNAPALSTTNSPAAAVAGTNAPAAPKPAAPRDFSAFKLITERNIFSPTRTARSARSADRPRPVQVDTFSLVGTMSSPKGEIAFFDGSGTQYRKALKAGDAIAGYQVAGVTAREVTLESGGKKLALRIGAQMRREDEGEWHLSSGNGAAPVESTRSGGNEVADAGGTNDEAAKDSDSSSSGGGSDALQRLLKKREQELKDEK